MTTGQAVVRVVMGVIGVAMLIGGILLLMSGLPEAIAGVIWLIPSGAVLIIISLIEVSRYRSQAAERGSGAPGPGGGETAPLEPRFQRTDELFVDPTSNRRMRVYLDGRTGERRYVAEG
jgi:UPF0716 family protein affecting phage T7 exclusion